MEILKIKRYTTDFVQSNQDCLFVFGDNLTGKGIGGQAVIRHFKNAIGVPTKKYPSNFSSSFFNDDEYDNNIEHIKNAVDLIPTTGYRAIYFPEDGLGTGLAQLPEKAPKTYRFLVNYINQKFNNIYSNF